MASPFPGMDPFLESPGIWSDFHFRFINYLCEFLVDSLPPDYEAGLGDRIYLVEQSPAERKQIVPDVSISSTPSTMAEDAPFRVANTDIALLEPVTIPLVILDEPREPYVEILHYPDRTLVTVIELLSPANKEEPGRTEYLAKRNAILRQDVNLVELDLLRGGRRLPLKYALPSADYYAFIARARARPDCEVYPWTLRQPLPRLPIPLRTPDPDVPLRLDVVLATAYEKGRFRRRIDYQASLVPQVSGPDDDWIRSLLNARSS